MAVINDLRDTDYIVCVCADCDDNDYCINQDNVIISYNGGFFEFRDKDSGCVFTNSEDALSRLDKIIDCGNSGDGDVFVIRWHPEVM